MDSFFSFINHFILLLSLVAVFDLFFSQNTKFLDFKHIASGIFIGVLCVSLMHISWPNNDQVYSSTLWVLLSLSGLFFGLLPTLIAVTMAMVFHFLLHSSGFQIELVNLLISAGVGLSFRFWLDSSSTSKYSAQSVSWYILLSMGFAVHGAVIFLLLTVKTSLSVSFTQVVFTWILFSFITLLLGSLLKRRAEKILLEQALINHKVLAEKEKNILQNIIDGIPDLIFYKSVDSKYLGCNKAFADFMKLDVESIKGKDDFALFESHRAAYFIEKDKITLRQNQSHLDEDGVTHADGKEIYFSTLKTPFKNTNGEVQGIVGVSRDVTERKKIEQTLLKNEVIYRNIIASAHDGFIIVSMNGSIVESNQSFAKMTGYQIDDLINKPVNTIESNEKHPFSTLKASFATTAKSYNYSSKLKHKDGHLIDVDVNVRFWDGDGGMFFCFVKDISESLINQQRLLHSESKFRRLFEKIPSISVQGYDRNRNVIFWNQASESLYGYTKQQAIGQKLEYLIIPEPARIQVAKDIDAWIDDGVEIPAAELMLQRADGSFVSVYSSHTLIYNVDNEPELYCIDIDLTAQKMAEDKALTLSQAIEQSPISMILTDIQGTIEFVNSYFEKVTGYSAEEVIGKSSRMLKSGLTPKSSYADLWGRISTGGTWQGELQNKKKNGDIFWEYAHIAPIIDNVGNTKHYLALKQDITQQKQQEEKILHQAHYDSLTSLPNRLLSLDRLSQMLKDAHRAETHVAVLFLDLDDFKKVNDTLGHGMGDELLIQAAERLNNAMRQNDVVGRLGGDEFIILLNNIHDQADIEIIAHKLLAQFCQPFKLNNRELVSTVSIGIAVYPDDSSDAKELLRQADSAMYHSKSLGRNTYNFFTDQMNHDMNRRLKIEEQLRHAITNNEFNVHFQPLVDMKTRRIIGAEALIRWNNDQIGPIGPDEFIPVAEQTGLIGSIGKYVMVTAFEAASHWQRTFNADFKIAINVSPKQFRDNSFVDMLKQLLAQYQLNSRNVELEITEGVLLSDDPVINVNLKNIIDIGVSISMDDFGTGYSSLSYLRSYPFDTLKVDKSFVNDINVDEGDLELVSAAIAMGHGLNMCVVAEGVETEEQYKLLNALKCDYGQGYLFSKPVPATDFEQLLLQELEE